MSSFLTPGYPRDNRSPNDHPVIGNTFIVDPSSAQIVHRIPVYDGITHHTWMRHLGGPGWVTTTCPCRPIVTHFKGEQIPQDVRDFFEEALRWVATETAECLFVRHRSALERLVIPDKLGPLLCE